MPEPEPPELRTPPLLPVRRPAKAIVASGVAVVAIILAASGWWKLHDRTEPPVAAVTAPAAPRPTAYSPQDRRQSVIVLPFENSSGDPIQDGVAAGITRDVTDAIAQHNAGPLVPAATAAIYRGNAIDLRAIGREHDVHFALTGNARRQDGHLIVATTLYDTADVRPVWSAGFDRPDNPDARKFTVAEIADNFDQATMDAEVAHARRAHPDSLDKRDLMFAARETSILSTSKEHLLAQITFVERALALDPNYVWALRENARRRAVRVVNGMSPDPSADLAIAVNAVDRALALKPNDWDTLKEKANVLRAQGNLDEAAAVLRGLIERNPLSGFRHRELGVILFIQGHPKEALEEFITARRVAKAGDSVEFIDANLASGLLANDRLPEAIEQARRTIGEFPSDSGRVAEEPWLVLIAAERASGQDAQARADLQKFLATPRTWRTMAEIEKFPYFAANPKLLEGLRLAGMPEE